MRIARILPSLFVAVLVSATVSLCQAADSAANPHVSCPNHFHKGRTPLLVNQNLAIKTRALCNTAYAVLHSGRTLGPLWSAEHLTRQSLLRARSLARTNSFRPDIRIPAGERAELFDYARSGFDRGHMAPNGDMPDSDSQAESFVLSNMIPQDPASNRHLWSDIESATRHMASREGEAFVVTGPSFYGPGRRVGRVAVPDAMWKAVYLPASKQAAAYFAPNKAGSDYYVISIAELTKSVGIDPFPSLPPSVKATAAKLTAPRARGSY